MACSLRSFSTSIKMFLACFVVFVLTSELASAESRRYFCQKPSDCGSDECCVMGMQRYTFPRCEKLGGQDDYCRMGNVPEDRVLAFPNGMIFKASGVYTMFCPCASGFTCTQATCKRGESEEAINDVQ